MKIKYFLLVPLISIFIISCDSTEPPIIPPPPPPDFRKITLTFEDASCTEVWLKIKTDSLTLPAELTLKQYIPTGDSLSQVLVLNTLDSVLYIDSLLPNQVYYFQAVLSNDTTIKSEKITAQTLVTTSHNFTWQNWEFGQYDNSVLYDVAIIDENNIWAVGEIYMNDSIGNPDPIAYNAAYWNGSVWKLKRIKTKACGGVDYPPIITIFAFSLNDILFAHIDGSISHFNGIEFTNDCSLIVQLNGSANKIWGISKNDFYVVSVNGFIAHYNGTTWEKIESGTTLSFYDIWGDVNPATNEYEIIALASDHTSGNGTKLFKINGVDVENISTEGLPLSMDAIWFKSERIYYAVGNGFYTTRKLGDQWIKDLSIPMFSKSAIRGTNYNNIFLGGAFGLLMHYNGTDWKNYQFIEVSYNDFFASLDVKDNLVCAVGANANNKAIVYLGNNSN